ncbi:MAG: peptidogalycan biosysnthesis protein [Phycisphaerales bacterium]|nr:peptidogalycan biosysnthesis protein [Phycisphaerales bacterium]
MSRPCSLKEDIQIYQSSTELPLGWDGCLPAHHPLSSKSLALYEKIKLPDVHYYYALLGNPSNPKAIAYFQLLHVLPKHLNTGLLSGYQNKIAPICLNVFKPSLLIAGHLFRHDTINFHTVGLSNIEAYRVYEKMIQSTAKKSGAMATLIKDVPEDLVPYFQNFAPHYNQLRNDISMQMQLPKTWSSFADYEAALKHKYAQKLRKVRNSLQQLKIVALNTEEVFQKSEIIFQLYKQVSTKQAFSLGFLNVSFLPELKKMYPNELKIWAFYEGDVMVAFASGWMQEHCFDMFYIGFDYERNATLNLYFNILYFSIEQAIVAQKPNLNLGRTALEAKARLGCNPKYLPTFLYVRNVCIRTLVSSKINLQHEHEGAWEERHPFKNT